MIKFNWGYGIFVFVLSFMAFILMLVYKSSQQRVDLVSKNYYEQELKYDGQMQKEKNALEAGAFDIIYDPEDSEIIIHYPTLLKNLSGKIYFFKPDNADLDFSVAVETGENGIQAIPVKNVGTGWWNVKVDCLADNASYYKERKLRID